MYQGFYDENHRMLKASMQDLTIITKPRTGEYDSNILCRECDNEIIGEFESYASSILYGGSESLSESQKPSMRNFVNQHGIEFTYCENLDYKKFKLFLLSVLWRASVSKRDLFSLIELGSHEDILREMIFEGNPKEKNDYPCVIYTSLSDDSTPVEFIVQPSPGKKGTTQFYKFPISGMFYNYFTSIGFDGVYNPTLPINENGELSVIHLPKGEGMRVLKSFSGKR